MDGWVYRCGRFFEIDETPMDARVKLASIHLEGRALQWQKLFLKNRGESPLPRWHDYISALTVRIGNRVFEDPISDLMKLRQNGELNDYLEEFDVIL